MQCVRWLFCAESFRRPCRHSHEAMVRAGLDMARFDVYPYPDPALRQRTPYLLDVQNVHISRIATRVVIPMRWAEDFALRMRELNPVFDVADKVVVLDTAAIAAVPLAELKKPLTNLGAQSAAIVAALDVLFWKVTNRGNRGISLDVRKPEGKALI